MTGKFTSNDTELSFTSWVAATKNLIVIELKNTVSQSLNLSSKLFDGFGSNGNEATYGSVDGSTWLKVSLDTVNLNVGNRLSMGPRGGFQGKIASLKIFDQALDSTAMVDLDSATSPKPLFHWST